MAIQVSLQVQKRDGTWETFTVVITNSINLFNQEKAS